MQCVFENPSAHNVRYGKRSAPSAASRLELLLCAGPQTQQSWRLGWFLAASLWLVLWAKACMALNTGSAADFSRLTQHCTAGHATALVHHVVSRAARTTSRQCQKHQLRRQSLVGLTVTRAAHLHSLEGRSPNSVSMCKTYFCGQCKLFARLCLSSRRMARATLKFTMLAAWQFFKICVRCRASGRVIFVPLW